MTFSNVDTAAPDACCNLASAYCRLRAAPPEMQTKLGGLLPTEERGDPMLAARARGGVQKPGALSYQGTLSIILVYTQGRSGSP
jgi:hypothetical protein